MIYSTPVLIVANIVCYDTFGCYYRFFRVRPAYHSEAVTDDWYDIASAFSGRRFLQGLLHCFCSWPSKFGCLSLDDAPST